MFEMHYWYLFTGKSLFQGRKESYICKFWKILSFLLLICLLMTSEVTLFILRRGIWPRGTIASPSTTSEPSMSVADLPAHQSSPSVSGPRILKSLTGSNPRSSRECQVPLLEEDCSYFGKLSRCALEENWRLRRSILNEPLLFWTLLGTTVGMLFGLTSNVNKSII